MSYLQSRSRERTEDFFEMDARAEARVGFLRRVYLHLFGAVLLFLGLATYFVKSGVLIGPVLNMVQGGQWWLLMIAFMAASWAARAMAHSRSSPALQYAGLGLYALAEAVIFTPLLMFVSMKLKGPDLLLQAGTVTLLIFGGLTAIVLLTGKNFSFLRNILWLGSLAALVTVLVGAFTGFGLGLFFVIAMIVLYSGWILYDTSALLHEYDADQHVAAALELFASLATLFWYVIRLMSILNDD